MGTAIRPRTGGLVAVDGDSLTLDDVEAVARRSAAVAIDRDVFDKVRRSRHVNDELIAQVPDQVLFVSQLPKNATGKILKRALRDQERLAQSNRDRSVSEPSRGRVASARMSSETLILEGEPGQRAILEAAIRGLFMVPVPAATPDDALSHLRHRQPILALIDPDMSPLPGARHRVDEVLQFLHERCGGCCVLVHSARGDDIVERERVERIHPLATFVAKDDGLQALVSRIRQMVGVRFGDLAVRRRLIFHEPSGSSFGHRVAVWLLLSAVTEREVRLEDATELQAALRLRTWLRNVGSCVHLVCLGQRCYGLRLLDRQHFASPPPADPRRAWTEQAQAGTERWAAAQGSRRV